MQKVWDNFCYYKVKMLNIIVQFVAGLQYVGMLQGRSRLSDIVLRVVLMVIGSRIVSSSLTDKTLYWSPS